jgi:hypothetical protein
LSFQRQTLTVQVPSGTFQEAAEEFKGALGFVATTIPNVTGPQLLSPPETIANDALPSMLAQKGRVHILLHGANRSPDWAYLYGHAPGASDYPRALSARLIDLCDMRSSIVTFGSCYAAMLDTGDSEAPARTEDNQVALACLGHGAKVVIGATRSNWIQMNPPYDGYGPGLIGHFWQQVGRGVKAAEALRLAKVEYLKEVVQGSPKDLPYARKTVLQIHCYGHPEAAYST